MVIIGPWSSLFYAHHHQQSLEMGTSIVSCQSLVGNTHLLMANIQLQTFSGSMIDVKYISYGLIVEICANPHE